MVKKKFKLGSGALVAAAFIGPGTVAVCSAVGAKFGFQLIWALVFSVITTIVLQEMVVRLTSKSGKNLAANIRSEISGQVSKYLVGFLVLVAIYVGSVAYESGNIAGAAWAVEGILGENKISITEQYSIDIYGLIIGGVAIAILSIGKYQLIERILIGLVVLMSLVFVVTAVIVQPNFLSLLSGFIPSVPDQSVLMIIGLVGTTVVPYNLFLQSSAILQNSAKTDYEELKQETMVSISLGGLISLAIIITSSAVFYLTDIEFAKVSDMAIQLKPLLGEWAAPFMTLGFLAAGISSAMTAPLAAAFTLSGLLGWNGGMKNKKFKMVWLSAILFGIFFFSAGIRPTHLILIAQVANGLLLPIIAIVLLVLMNKGNLLNESKNSVFQNAIGIIVILITAILGVKSLSGVFGLI